MPSGPLELIWCSFIAPRRPGACASYLRPRGHYAFKYCSPSRSAFQSGRNPIHVNVLNINPWVWNASDPVSGAGSAGRGHACVSLRNARLPGAAGFQGVPPKMTLVSEKLAAGGYYTAAVGKWVRSSMRGCKAVCASPPAPLAADPLNRPSPPRRTSAWSPRRTHPRIGATMRASATSRMRTSAWGRSYPLRFCCCTSPAVAPLSFTATGRRSTWRACPTRHRMPAGSRAATASTSLTLTLGTRGLEARAPGLRLPPPTGERLPRRHLRTAPSPSSTCGIARGPHTARTTASTARSRIRRGAGRTRLDSPAGARFMYVPSRPHLQLCIRG